MNRSAVAPPRVASPADPWKSDQLDAWEPAIAWTYWSYKMMIDTPACDVWDFGKAIDLGFLPAEVLG